MAIEESKEDILLLEDSKQDQQQEERSNDNDDNKLSSDWQAGWNIINGQQGAALLGAPYAVSVGGFWALIPLFLVGLIANYTSKILIDCLFETHPDGEGEKKRMIRHSYMDVAEASFKFSGIFVRFAVFVSAFSISVLYLQTIAAILEDLLYEVESKVPIALLLGVVVVFSFVFVFLSNLTSIAFLSFWALVSLCLLTISISYFSVQRSSKWHADYLLSFQFKGLMYSTSIIVFNFSAQFFIIDVFKSMRRPTSFARVLDSTTVASVLLFSVISLSACLTFGQGINEFVILSVPRGTLRYVINVTFALKSFLSFPFAIFLCEEYFPRVTLPDLNTKYDLVYWVSCLRRTFFMICSYAFAIFVPSYAFVLYLIGGAIMVFTEIIFPALFHLKLKANPSYLQVTIDIFIIFYGSCIGAATIIFSFDGV